MFSLMNMNTTASYWAFLDKHRPGSTGWVVYFDNVQISNKQYILTKDLGAKKIHSLLCLKMEI